MQITSHIVMKDGEARIESKEYLKAEMVARMYVDGGHSIEAVMEQYGLPASDVHAAIAYYYDNQPELDAAYAETLAEISQNAMTLEKFKTKLTSRKNPPGDQ